MNDKIVEKKEDVKRHYDGYFGYLCSVINIPPEYTYVMYFIYNKTFYSSLKLDENRIHDAFRLRNYYCEDNKIEGLEKEEVFSFDPNCLEILISLAKRLEDDILYNNKEGDRTKEWFWMFIKNLGLDNIEVPEKEDISNKLDKWLERKYDKNGKNGNIIVLNGLCRIDLRKLEIWDQFQVFATYNS